MGNHQDENPFGFEHSTLTPVVNGQKVLVGTASEAPCRVFQRDKPVTSEGDCEEEMSLNDSILEIASITTYEWRGAVQCKLRLYLPLLEKAQVGHMINAMIHWASDMLLMVVMGA